MCRRESSTARSLQEVLKATIPLVLGKLRKVREGVGSHYQHPSFVHELWLRLDAKSKTALIRLLNH
jgi:hypothetical protein